MTEYRFGWKCPNCEANNHLVNVPALEEHYMDVFCPTCGYVVSVCFNLDISVLAHDEINDACWEVTTRNDRLVCETEFDWAQESIINRGGLDES